MKKIKNILILTILLIFLLIGIFVLINFFSQEQKNDKINVIVSILPQKAFVKAVGGDLVNVKEIIPPGGSPATYEPKPSDLVLVERADIYFRIGHISFEKSHLNKFIELNSKMEVVDTSLNSELRFFGENEEHSHEEEHEEEHELNNIDPHIWLSPMQVKNQVEIITQTLIKKDSDNANIYTKNAEDFKKQLDELHLEIESELNELKTDKLMVFHPAWGYFAQEYDLEQIAIEQSGKEPTARELQHIIEEAKEEEIKVIFVQSQFNKEIADSVADEVGAIAVSIDPLSENYINNLRNVAITISENLNK